MTAAITHIHHINVSSVDVVNTMLMSENVATNNVDVNQQDDTDDTKIGVPKWCQRKTCAQTKLRGCPAEYVYFQLREFVGAEGFHLQFQSFCSFS